MSIAPEPDETLFAKDLVNIVFAHRPLREDFILPGKARKQIPPTVGAKWSE
jgi:hypothetical protein